MSEKELLPICPVCGRKAQLADAAFCAYCGAAMQLAAKPVSEDIQRILAQADKLTDPVKKHRLLAEAEQTHPDSLEIAETLLFLGRLHERDPKRLDYSVIKCYLWHMYLTPEQFSEEQKTSIRTELFHHPQLQKCMALAPDADAYLRRYLQKLASEFVHLFLKGSSHYTRSFFGFRLDGRMARVLAEPAADVLCRIREDEELTPPQRAVAYDAFYRAFLSETGGEAKWLNELLTQHGYPVPVRL